MTEIEPQGTRTRFILLGNKAVVREDTLLSAQLVEMSNDRASNDPEWTRIIQHVYENLPAGDATSVNRLSDKLDKRTRPRLGRSGLGHVLKLEVLAAVGMLLDKPGMITEEGDGNGIPSTA